MKITFFDGTSVIVSHQEGRLVKKAIDAGADWIEVVGNQYRVSAISRIENKEIKYKTFSELGLPKLDIPADIEQAYSERTVSLKGKKLLGR